MSAITSLRIETWGEKFVVVGEFQKYTTVPRQEFDTYYDALKELARIAKREEIRYETYGHRGFNW